MCLTPITQVILFGVAYIATVIITPVEDQLTYEYDRNPYFYRVRA